jgi:alkanesulfonate monooxygenase SsuD/methylene tetrahydromethanopterin reductase-like flavin-dependent oxidoreductase (luciferase family)
LARALYKLINKDDRSLPLGDNSDVVRNKVRETFRGIPEEQIKEFVIYGTPEDVSIQIQMLEEIGIQYLIV